MKEWMKLGLTALVLSLSANGSASDCPAWLASVFDSQLKTALTGAKFTTQKKGLEEAVDSVLRAHFEKHNRPYTKEAVDESILELDIDFVGESLREIHPSPEVFSVEFRTNAFYRARYTVEVDIKGASEVKLMEVASGANARDRLYKVAPATQKTVLDELKEIAAKPGFKIYDLSYKLKAIFPKSMASRRSFVLEYFDNDFVAGIRLAERLDLEQSDNVFVGNFLSALDRNDFWKSGLDAKLEKLAATGKKYVDEPYRALQSNAEGEYLRKNLALAKEIAATGDLADHATRMKLYDAVGALYSIPGKNRVEMIKKTYGNVFTHIVLEGSPSQNAFQLLDYLQRSGRLADRAKLSEFIQSLDDYHFNVLE